MAGPTRHSETELHRSTVDSSGANVASGLVATADGLGNVRWRVVPPSGVPGMVGDDGADGAPGAPGLTGPAGAAGATGPAGSSDTQHINNVTFSGDGVTTAFELPAAPFDAYSVAAYVAGVRLTVALSGAMLTTMTFVMAPDAATDNIIVDIVAAAA